MNWLEVGKDALKAAQTLKAYPRSCISRSYYAAYAIASHALEKTKGVKFPSDRDGPSHSDLPYLIENHLRNKL